MHGFSIDACSASSFSWQLSTLQEEVQQKDLLLKEQVSQHQAELQRLAAQSALEAEMQQNLRLLQRKLEEQEAALLGRTQVVELLQQELNEAEEQKQVLLEKFQKVEAELGSLQDTLASERQQSRSLVERLELELAEKKMASHHLQEEVQQLSQELAHARADHERQSQAAEQRHMDEMAEKSQEIAQLQSAEQDLCASYEALQAENAQLRQNGDRPPKGSTEESSVFQGEAPEKLKEPGYSEAESEAFPVQASGQVSAVSEPVDEQSAAELPARNASQPEDQEFKTVAEALEAKIETLPAKWDVMEKRPDTASPAESSQVSGAEGDTEEQSYLAPGVPPCFGDSLSDPGGLLEGPGNDYVEDPCPPDSPAALPQAHTITSPEDPLVATDNGQPDILAYLSAKKQRDLSVLLLELQEAQEEIAFLKGQLQDSKQLDVGEAEEPREQLPDSGAEEREGRGEEVVPCQSDSSSSSLVTVDVPEEPSPLPGMLFGQDGLCMEERGAAQELPPDSMLHFEIAELRERQKETEEDHKRTLEERMEEIQRLQQQVENSERSLCTLSAERDELLSRLEDLHSLAELKEQVKQLEGNLADSEKRRLSDYECGVSQLGLLTEEIQSLRNEASSKEVKIAALEKDLDEAQHCLMEQDLLTKGLKSQLEREEQEKEALAVQLQEGERKAEELSESLSLKGQEVTRLEELLSKSSVEIERLQQEVAEREDRMEEVSRGMSDRMVQLNEEKFMLGKEVKNLTERLSLCMPEKPTRDQGVGTEEEEEEETPPEQQVEKALSASQEVEGLRKENQLVRKKLQAALVSRKELLGKVRRLEKELDGREAPAEPGAKSQEIQESKGEEEPPEGSGKAEENMSPSRPGRTACLSQLVPMKEAELQAMLKEKESEVVTLRAAVVDLEESLQEKNLFIGSLQAKLEGHISATKKQITVDQSAEGAAAADPLAPVVDGTTDTPGRQEEESKASLEEKISALEQERDQLQKKLQDALTSRKDTLKKGQEKDRHHREQLKQQKDDYSLLQEQFEQQGKEKESLQDQLRALSKTLENSAPAESEPSLGVVQESVWEAPERSDGAGRPCPLAEDSAMEQLKAELEQLRAEKGELEAHVLHLEGELIGKSEMILQLQEEARQLHAEMEAVKAACRQAEASMEHLRLELEESQAEAARLRLHQADLEEQKTLTSKEEIEALSLQLAERDRSLHQLQAELQEKEGAVQALQSQLERQNEEQAQRLRVELAEAQQKSAEEAAEDQSRAHLQRKLQAALISRKDALKESKLLKEELGRANAALESASLCLSGAENRAVELEKEKEVLLKKLAVLGEEREKLIAEVDAALVENQNLSGSCESLKLALEGLSQEKVRLEEAADSQRSSHIHELSEWQEKHRELQKEYETLLQSYENVSNEAERIQRVVEGVRQEKQEIFLKLKDAEAEKKEVEARLQGTEQEVEGMKEKMRKFAKSKQQKILELEEENERLRAEVHPMEGEQGEAEEASALLRGELESSKRTCESLYGQLKILTAEKEALNQEVQDLKQLLKNEVEVTGQNSGQEGTLLSSEEVSSAMAVPLESTAAAQTPFYAVSETPGPISLSLKTEPEASPSCDKINRYIQQVEQLGEQVAKLDEKRRVGEEELSRVLRDLETLREEKKGLEDLLAEKVQELEALRGKVFKMEQASQGTEEQLARALKLKEALEAEKDDLEERLMNQLAELNGSIGNYQQDVADLQSKNQLLQSEMESLQETLSHLEDEKRRLLKEKAQVEADKRESVEKLKSAWKGDNGRTQVKELQELLKEKQQEVRQLQKDCIKCQEKITSLERTIKALEFVQSESQKELEGTRRSLAEAGEGTQKAQAELASCKVLLDDTQSEAARVLAESLKVKEELQTSREEVKVQLRQKEKDLERQLEQEKGKHSKEMSNMVGRLEALRRDQARLEGEAQELRDTLHHKDQEAKRLQGSLNHTLAQLAAFTRSMSSLQDDRDRVIDESRQWEKKFSEAIEKKEQEVRAREESCVDLEERAKRATAQVEDLQSQLTSLEHSKLAQESSAQKELQRLQEEAESLQQEKGRLTSQLEDSQKLLSSSQSQVQKQEIELHNLSEQLSSLQESLAEYEKAQEEMVKMLKSQEADLQESRFRHEQLEADLQASKELTERLQEEMSSKDQKIVNLLSAKEEAVSVAVSELQQRHKEDLIELEDRIDKVEEEKLALETEKRKILEKVDHLTGKLKNTREESKQHKAQLDSFTRSMSSLQDDRDRILADYHQLEQRHLAAILEKDQLIQEAAAENNTLKEELRSLHGRMDDLHAENAKLEAELVRYRQDLNQVISIKDCQQKQLLKTQLERIQALEKEKAGVEGQLRESESALDNLRSSLEALRLEKGHMEQEAEDLKASLSQLQSEMTALQDGGPMLELQTQLQGKVEEVLELSGQLSLMQQQAAKLEEEMTLLRQTTEEKLREAEVKMKKELKNLHHDAGLMRNETETAEERVAELAKDLLEMEQRLLAVTEENQDLKAQIQSFRKAMSSLQDSWDQCNEELQSMEKKYSEELEEQRLFVKNLREEKAQAQEELKDLSKERDRLASDLAVLRESSEEKGLLARLEKLNQQLQAKDRELLHMASELEAASAQVNSFSKAMASLQGERERLLSELGRARKAEIKLQSDASASAGLAEVPSLKKALSSLQNDRDRLLVELKNLQQQYLQVGVDTAEITRLKAQLQDLEQLKAESASWQRELQQLREEKAAWELEVLSLRGQQRGPLVRAMQETARAGPHMVEEDQYQRQVAPENMGSSQISAGDGSGPGADADNLQAQLKSSLKELHQKELRIQQLNSKLSQVFEEKNSLSLQLRGSSHSLRESQQRYSDVLSRCEVLEKQLQEVQPSSKARGSLLTDAAPGAPQEKSEHPRESYTPELQELQMRLSEAQQQQSNAKEGLMQLEELLQEEQDRRLAAEEAYAAAQDHIRRLESAEWTHALDTSIDIPPSPEHAMLVGPADGSFSKIRGSTGLRRVLRSLFCSRRRLPLLATVYLLTVHILLLLCFTGHL
ncbi:golgin subfamily B member 1 isoform X2 [Sceloporus undulatus]|uniref:golgin subfamily B member 1 isoform X2 n=1 Tax=Sceloporus undulatus TaxID=8520 RepID=UPI001C4BCCEE|nr:golgin subfamily B member 1 isoform X2 [Sceloporus undulatus]